MKQHTGIMAHDGYAEHSHEVRPDHHGVSRTWTGLAAEPKGVQDVVLGRFAGGKSNLAGPVLAAAQTAANAGALDTIAGLLRESPRLDDADLIDALFDIVGQTGRITDPDGLDTEDDPAAQAHRDALMPWTCRECGTEVMAPGEEPDHPEWCPAGAPVITKGDVIRIVPERGPERVMTVAHVEHHIITLADDPAAAWEVVPGEVMTVDAHSADEAVRAAIAEAGETADGRGYEPDPNQYYWARRAGTRGPWQRIPV